jgi:hypothetical protein
VRGDWVPEEGVDYDLLSIDLRASATSPVPAFTQAELYFLQRPQVFATNVEAKPRVVQRGDTMLIEAEVMNTRFDPDSISVLLQVVMRDTSGNIIQSGQEQLNVGPNARALFRSSVATEFVSGTVSLELVIDEPLKQSMRYRVFTRALGSANVVEDSIAPVVELSADGVRRTSGMAVSVNPHFDVLLRDNSALSIESADNLVVFVNGTRVRPSTAEEWEFYGTRQLAASFPGQPDARAMLSFRFPMEIGENLVIIRARDATGNPDTSEISLFLPTSATIVGMSVFPNPTATGMAGVSVDLAIPDGLSLLRVTAYDLQGRRISTSTLGVSNGHYRTVLGAGEYPLETGMYTVVAELMDEAGKTLSTLTKKLVVSP